MKRVIAESTYSFYNPFITSAGDILNVLPAINQGTGSNQRIGTEIVVAKIVIKGFITATFPATAVKFAKLGIRHLLLRKRNRNSYIDVQSGDLLTLLEREAGPSSYSGFLLDHYANINKKQWVAGKDRKYNLRSPYVTGVGTPSTIEAPNGTITVPFKWVLGKGARLRFENGALEFRPQNWPWFMALGFTYYDNSVPSVLDTPIAMQYTTTMDYFDA